MINQTTHVEVCGKLQLKDKTINSATKTFVEIPTGKLIDVSVNYEGANILIETLGVKKVYYAGKSHPDATNYYDIGVLNKDVA